MPADLGQAGDDFWGVALEEVRFMVELSTDPDLQGSGMKFREPHRPGVLPGVLVTRPGRQSVSVE
jgi:hypothetical protein